MLIRWFLVVKIFCVHWESRIILGLLNFFYTLNIEQKKAVKIKRHISRKTFQRILMDIVKIISTPIWATKIFLRFQLYYMLDIVPSCNLVQYQGKLIMQPWENGKNPNFKSNLEPLPSVFLMGVTSNSSSIMFQAIIPCNFQEIW